jgi:hypothetical protein
LIEDIEQGEQLTPEELAEREQRRIVELLQGLGEELAGKRDEAIRARAETEDRWLQDLRQYHGKYDAETEAKLSADPSKSQVFANLTRSKVVAAEARIGDMLFPTDDRSWDLSSTPQPDMPIAEAKAKAEAMREEIDDQMREASWHRVARDVIHHGCLLGTGIVKGPIVLGEERKQWSQQPMPDGTTVSVLQWVTDVVPSLQLVDPWNFYPMEGATISSVEGVFERHFLTTRDVRELMRKVGFIEPAVRSALKEGPRTSHTSAQLTDASRRREAEGLTEVPDATRYELWEYHGPLSKDALAACGCDVDLDDPLEQVMGTVWMIGNWVVKAALNPLETEPLPYSVWNWEASDTSVFGYSVPWQLRHPQRVANAAWRGEMENASLTVGPQLLIDTSAVTPADGTYTMYGKKVWLKNDAAVPMSAAFGVFDVPSRQAELHNIFTTAYELADLETGLPMVAQGEQGNATQTAHGMQLLLNSANVVLRRAVKNWDDEITVPLITRFYDWNMQNSERDDIKGDLVVDARGSSALLVKEMQAQSLMILMQFAGSPIFGPMMKPAPLLRKTVQAHQISADDVVYTDEELQAKEQQAAAAAQQGQGVDPALQIKQMELQQAYQIHQDKLADAERDRQHKAQLAMLERDTAMVRLAAEKDLSLEKIRAQLAATTSTNQTKRDLFEQEKRLKVALGSGV